MLKTTKRFAALLMSSVLFASSVPAASAADAGKLTYEVTYSAEDLSTPMDWYNSDYFDNPEYKENRFVQYWVETPIAPGGPRDTGFYIVYNEEGMNIFFQSNEQEREANGVLKNSSLEIFLQTGHGDLPYHQMIIPTNGGPVDYFEWQTEYRNNRPLKGNVTVVNEEIPTGWGTVVRIPWETYYEHVPLNGEDWEFAMIRWSPSHSPTWGGRVHQAGRFNVLDIQAPTAEQRTNIQKNVIRKAWAKFNETSATLRATWLNGDADDERFFNRYLQPLIAEGEAKGAEISNLDAMSAAEVDAMYAHVDEWFELRYDAEDARTADLKNRFFAENEAPTVADVTYSTLKNTPAAGTIVGTDPDGGALTFALGTAPLHGTATVTEGGDWTYAPNEDYVGTDAFTVVATDASGETATATVSVTVLRGPETTASISPGEPNGGGGWYTSDVTVALATTADDAVGANRTEYRIDGGDWTVYVEPIVLTEDGAHVVEYRGVDNAGHVEATRTATIAIDKSAPEAAVVLDVAVLWPPNHKLMPIQATVTSGDGEGGSGVASVRLVSIASSEPDEGTDGEDVPGDVADAEYGTEDTSFSLRAERSDGGSGRVYTITYAIADVAGNVTTVEATVTVPHNQ
ncbi:hypothetical protein FE782_15435 [Paenibacillus antri]|uniref:Cadherin domain-containing protein n=1 Tax=Paenibacillus antri TaxID=2582848 RepID=A0A5R9GBQ2_9BACL|nr:Ig-like domain-containing protein [Paenibacillus antri]TLS51500.1 hypothetical protein FE782_15435 [Paenibacillus antri]